MHKLILVGTLTRDFLDFDNMEPKLTTPGF